ncbi:MAG: aminotransferase class V-fold PLP-dependent enzyme [Saprospiraceae bacterium]
MQLDLNFIRSQFPIFQTELGQQIGFFDNAGGSFPAMQVVDRLIDFYKNYKIQPYGPNALGMKAGEAMDLGQYTMAKLLNVSKDEMTIGASATQNLNTLAIACNSIVTKGNEVIVTEQDHEANIGGWDRLCRQQNAILKIWKVQPETGELLLEDLEKLLTPQTKILCVTHSSNIIGTINPINKIASLTRPMGIRLVVDGVSFAPHEFPNLDELKCDAYVFSTYKTYGTHQGVMVVRPDFLEELDPQCHFFNQSILYKRLDTAGPNHASIAALAGIGDYFEAAHDHHFPNKNLPLHEKTRKISHVMNTHENKICTYLLENIQDLPLRIFGKKTMDGREANISMKADNVSSKSIMDGLAKIDIASKQGHFYAYRLMQAMKVDDLNDGILRLSFSHYNSMEEVERCVDGLKKLIV